MSNNVIFQTTACSIVPLFRCYIPGHYQIDPARFPGPGSTATCLNETALIACLRATNDDPAACGCVNGNEGMRALSNELRMDGFQWGSYSNMAGRCGPKEPTSLATA